MRRARVIAAPAALALVEDDKGTTWYETSYSHRVAWVPASEVTVR